MPKTTFDRDDLQWISENKNSKDDNDCSMRQAAKRDWQVSGVIQWATVHSTEGQSTSDMTVHDLVMKAPQVLIHMCE